MTHSDTEVDLLPGLHLVPRTEQTSTLQPSALHITAILFPLRWPLNMATQLLHQSFQRQTALYRCSPRPLVSQPTLLRRTQAMPNTQLLPPRPVVAAASSLEDLSASLAQPLQALGTEDQLVQSECLDCVDDGGIHIFALAVTPFKTDACRDGFDQVGSVLTHCALGPQGDSSGILLLNPQLCKC